MQAALQLAEHDLVGVDKKIYEDTIVVLDPDGTVIDEFSLLDALVDTDYVGLLERTRAGCDPLHLNDVRVLKAADADAYPSLAVGDILVSTNAVNAVAVVDRGSRRIKWLAAGSVIAQHNPRFIGDNRILVFDNRGGARIDGQGGSRIVAIDVATGLAETVFPQPDSSPSLDFHTDVAGHFDLDRLRSRALVSLYDQGRVIEVDLRTGDVLWEYAEVHDIDDDADASAEDEPATYARFLVAHARPDAASTGEPTSDQP